MEGKKLSRTSWEMRFFSALLSSVPPLLRERGQRLASLTMPHCSILSRTAGISQQPQSLIRQHSHLTKRSVRFYWDIYAGKATAVAEWDDFNNWAARCKVLLRCYWVQVVQQRSLSSSLSCPTTPRLSERREKILMTFIARPVRAFVTIISNYPHYISLVKLV